MALKISSLHEETTDRVREILQETKRKYFDHKMQLATGENIDAHEARNMRRDMARLETMLRAVEIVKTEGNINEDDARKILEECSWTLTKAVKAAKSAPKAQEE